MSKRILFVDDEPGIRETLPAALKIHGFEVTTTATVGKALGEITSSQFDILIADLNIGQPGDGFTVVSAMRRTQPNCVTFILTGYPALETALQAIRNQVDDYLIKPVEIPALVATITGKVTGQAQRHSAVAKRLSAILRENISSIVDRTVREMKSHPIIGAMPLTDRERVDAFPLLIESLASQLDSKVPNEVPEFAIHGAAIGGAAKGWKGYDALTLIETMRLFESAIYDVVHENLFSVDLSYLLIDLKRINASLGKQLARMIEVFLAPESRGAKALDQKSG
jgi:DNA-binding response OmpR family regulator